MGGREGVGELFHLNRLRSTLIAAGISLLLVASPMLAVSAPSVTTVRTNFVVAGSGLIPNHPLGERANLFVWEVGDGLVHIEIHFCELDTNSCNQRVVENVPDQYVFVSPTQRSLQMLGTSVGDIDIDLTHAAESNGWGAAMCPFNLNAGPYHVLGEVTHLQANIYGTLGGYDVLISSTFGGCVVFGKNVTFQFTALR